jgi:CitMHS family citrate-Mg2+:H+ or citrate-Ca2+:H+ symporter
MPDAFTGLVSAAEEAPTYDVAFLPPEWVLVLLGFTMVLVFMTLIMTKRLTPMVALILVPTIFGLFAGAGLGIGDMVLDAIGSMAPTAALLMFAIMYFGIMIDVGLFDPLIRLITRLLGNDPAKVVIGTALLAGAVSLDGDGSTTFIITTSAMLPIYLRLGMSPVVLTCVAGLMNVTLYIVPWGGPTVRAATALKVDASDIFVPMLPALGVGLIVSLSFAWLLGIQERNRLGRIDESRLDGTAEHGVLSSVPKIFRGPDAKPGARAALHTGNIVTVTGGHGSQPASGVDILDTAMADTMLDPNRATLRPKLIWVNLALTLAVMVLLVLDIFPLPYVFMVGSCLALLINFG